MPTRSRDGLQIDPVKLAYRAVPKDNPKDRIEVVVGDDKDESQFHPQVKIQRWDNEVNSSIRLQLPGTEDETVTQDVDESVVFEKGIYTAKLYERDDMDEGGFEFEIHLAEKPATNQFTFTVNTKSLDWYYQPPLTQQEIDEGAERPDNVIGSYAVYHSTKGGMNRADGMEYKTGKAFHVYRPHAVDAKGNETWGELSLNEQSGILTVTVPEKFLERAVYPVIVDPTFGYTSVPASSSTTTLPTSNKHTAPSESGDITSISVYRRHFLGTAQIAAAIYSHDSGNNDADAKLAEDTGNVMVSSTAGWHTVNLSYSFTANTVYWLCQWTSDTTNYYFDTGGGTRRNGSGTFETWPNPFNGGSSDTRETGIYATYTASGGTTTSTSSTTTTSTSSSSSTTTSTTTSQSTSTTTSSSTSSTTSFSTTTTQSVTTSTSSSSTTSTTTSFSTSTTTTSTSSSTTTSISTTTSSSTSISTTTSLSTSTTSTSSSTSSTTTTSTSTSISTSTTTSISTSSSTTTTSTSTTRSTTTSTSLSTSSSTTTSFQFAMIIEDYGSSISSSDLL